LNFDVDRYLRSSPIKAMRVFRKGQVPPKDNPEHLPRPDSGFAVLVGDDQESGITGQIGLALQFLAGHEKELDGLRQLGVDDMLFDFGIQVGNQVQHSEYLPPELIIGLARFKMGVMFSAIRLPCG